MPRPGFVLEVDERTPPLLVHEGEGFRMQKFPLGTRVVYPPDALPGIRDVDAAVQHALLHPLGDSKPLPELLFAGHEAHDRDRRHLDPAAADAHARRPAADHRARDRARRAQGRRGPRADHRHRAAPPDDQRGDPPRGGRARVPLVLARRSCTTSTPRTRRRLLEIGTTDQGEDWSRSPSAPPSPT